MAMAEPFKSPIRKTHSRQATLHTATGGKIPPQNAPRCRFNPESYTGSIAIREVLPRTRSGLHVNRVVVSMPLEIALKTQTHKRLPPAPTPNWAFEAGTTGFVDMPFEGFLGPSWETAVLTRILRRRIEKTMHH
jgi:hypothetical protein